MTGQESPNVVELSSVTKRFKGVVAVDNCSLVVEKGQIVSLLGPSGCGKTTTLRLIAGFEQPDEGVIRIANQDVRGTRPYERNIGLLFQDYALFPHMSVKENVGYGLKRRGATRDQINRGTSEMLELVQLSGMEERRPGQLSGGQQQRVALARALATSPEVLLLDEPLSALDAKLRQQLQIELKEILERVECTCIVVTHDQEEAMSLADHVVVMHEGKILQRGAAREIYDHPRTKFVAEFIGRSNWFSGTLRDSGPGEASLTTAEGDEIKVPGPEKETFGDLEVCLRPERITIVEEAQAPPDLGKDMNVLTGEIMNIQHLGPDTHFIVELRSGKRIFVVNKNTGQPLPRTGAGVRLCFDRNSCVLIESVEQENG